MPASSKPTSRSLRGWGASSNVRVQRHRAAAPTEVAAVQDALNLLSTEVTWVSKQQAEILWEAETPWWSLLDSLLNHLSKQRSLRLSSDDKTVLEGVRAISDRGGAPAWCLRGDGGQHFKLRVDPDPDVSARIVDLLTHAESISWGACARLMTFNTHAVLKTWVAGEPLLNMPESTRPRLIHATGQQLAQLHGDEAEDIVHLICSADEHNTIVRSTGAVAFVDLEASRRGSRWVDVVWSEELLCRTQEEREWLWAGYSSTSIRGLPSPRMLHDARKEFRHWLLDQLRRAHCRHPQHVQILDDILRVERAIHAVSASFR